jgi:hypothetical protein
MSVSATLFLKQSVCCCWRVCVRSTALVL